MMIEREHRLREITVNYERVQYFYSIESMDGYNHAYFRVWVLDPCAPDVYEISLYCDVNGLPEALTEFLEEEINECL